MNASRPDTPRIIAPPPLLLVGCLLAGWGLEWLRPFEPFDLSFNLRVILGCVFYVAALGLACAAILVMHRHNTPTEPWRPTQRIVNSGPFAFTRNPIYVAFLLVMAGVAIHTASGWMMLLLPVLFLLLRNGVVLEEERYLTGKFGGDYLTYMRQVRRWI